MMSSNLKREIVKLVAADYLLTNLPGHLYWKDANNIFLGCNLEQARTVGLTDPDQVIGKTNFDLFDPKTAAQLHEADLKVLKHGEIIEKEERVGSDQYFLSKKAPLHDASGQIVGLVGTSMNITKQKKLEEQLAKKTEELEKALAALTKQAAELQRSLELKERILRNVSHEIRTPLTGVTCVIDGMLGFWEGMSDKERLEDLQRVAKSQHQLQELVIRMLDISKLKSGTEILECCHNDLVKLARDAIDEFSRSRKGVISIEVQDGLNTVVNCDRLRLAQVLRNVIANAVRYSKPETPIVVRIAAAQGAAVQAEAAGGSADDVLEVSITDQGVGVPEDEKHDVFLPFYESKRTRRSSGGTGLGLSITREIVDAHGGKIWAQPNKVGTTFVFTIPRNITERDQLSQEVFKNLAIEQAPANLYLKDCKYRLRACNQEQAKDLGLGSIRDILGKTNPELLVNELTGAQHDAVDRRVLEAGESIEVEEVGVNNQYYLSRKVPVRGANNKIIGLIGASMNITKLKTKEFDLEKKLNDVAQENAELKKALEMKGGSER